MSKYYNNYNNRNFKNNKHKKHNGKISSIISIVFIVFAILAVVGGLVALMRHDIQPNDDKVTVTTDNQGSNFIGITPTVNEITIFVDDSNFEYLDNSASPPWFVAVDATGVNETIHLSTDLGRYFVATVPAGYTHIVMYGDIVGEDDPCEGPVTNAYPLDSNGNNLLILATGEWTTYIPEE